MRKEGFAARRSRRSKSRAPQNLGEAARSHASSDSIADAGSDVSPQRVTQKRPRTSRPRFVIEVINFPPIGPASATATVPPDGYQGPLLMTSDQPRNSRVSQL